MKALLLHAGSAEPLVAEMLGRIAGPPRTVTGSAAAAEQLLRSDGIDTFVFDASLVDAGTVRRLRRAHPERTLVAWLSARSSARAAELLEAGADDVLDPTMSEREVAARLERARRLEPVRADVAELGRLRVDAGRGEASWDGRPIPLSRREREVQHVLVDSAGETVRREVLYRHVWGYAMARGDRSVDVNVKRLRDKLAAAGVGVRITTRPGVGYRLEPADAP